MNKAPSIHSNLNDETLLRLNKIKKIEDYFTAEIKERKTISKRLNKYIATFDYIDKILIVLSPTSLGISIISFSSIIGTPVGITSASFNLVFSLTRDILNKLLKKKQKIKRRNIMRLLC